MCQDSGMDMPARLLQSSLGVAHRNSLDTRSRRIPFWNMSRNDDGVTAKKMDVILGGMETIGSAERSCDVDMMRDTFHSITGGAYSKLLFELFGKERVEAELEKFLEFDFFQRVGGGIGMTRMIAALDKKEELAKAA